MELEIMLSGKNLLTVAIFRCIVSLTTPATLLRLFRQARAPGGFFICGGL